MIHVPLQDSSSDASIPDAIIVGTPGTLVALGVVNIPEAHKKRVMGAKLMLAQQVHLLICCNVRG